MFIKTLTLGPIETNCYILCDEKTMQCAVIDPADEASYILDFLEDNKMKCVCIFLTHAHFDHTGAALALMEETGAPLYMHKADNGTAIGSGDEVFNAPEGTIFYKNGDIIDVGEMKVGVMDTPGHTPGSVTLICENALFTGDTLFRDSCGRTDFRLGSTEDILKSLKRLAQLPGDYEVYPGHMFSTTLDRERRYNYYIAAAMQR